MQAGRTATRIVRQGIAAIATTTTFVAGAADMAAGPSTMASFAF